MEAETGGSQQHKTVDVGREGQCAGLGEGKVPGRQILFHEHLEKKNCFGESVFYPDLRVASRARATMAKDKYVCIGESNQN